MPDMETINDEVRKDVEDQMHEDKMSALRKTRSSSFQEKESDPGFLVAKGRFSTPAEQELKKMINSGIATNDPRIPDLRKQIESERRAAEKRHVKDLASAIFMAVSNHGYATVRCIGRNACYNAAKSIAISTGYCATKGVKLTFSLGFDEGNLGVLRQQQHVANVTALVYTLEGHSNYQPE